MKFKILLLALISAAFLSACDKKETPAPAPNTNAQQTTQPAAPAAPAADPAAPAAPVASTPASGSTGVPECDEYLTKVMACYETKVPEAVRGAMIDGLNQMKAAWMATPADQKGALADGCKQALEGSKASLQAYGCTL